MATTPPHTGEFTHRAFGAAAVGATACQAASTRHRCPTSLPAVVKERAARLWSRSLAGGYIITPDHGIRDNVSWCNFLYFYEELGRMLGAF